MPGELFHSHGTRTLHSAATRLARASGAGRPREQHGGLVGGSSAAEAAQAAVPARGEQLRRRARCAAGRGGRRQRGARRSRRAPRPGAGGPRGARVPRRVRRGRRRDAVRDAPSPVRVPGGLRLLPHSAQLPRPLRHLPGARQAGDLRGGRLHRRAQRPVHDAAPGALRPRRGDLPPPRAPLHPAVPEHGGLARGGGAGHLLGHRRPPRQDGHQPGRHRHPGGELQPVRAHPVVHGHDHPQVRDAAGHPQRAPLRDGLQRGAHLRGSRQELPPGGSEGRARAGGVDGDHHPQLLRGQGARHAAAQLPLPHGRRRRAAVDVPRQGQVPPRPRGAHADGRAGQRVPVRVPGGGRRGPPRDQPVKGPDDHRGGRAQGQHHGHRAPGAAGVGAAPVRAVLHRAARAEPAREAVPAGLPHGVRALLHPRGRARRHRRAAAEPGAVGRGRGGVADGAAPVRQHVQQLGVVRAGVHRGKRTDATGRPRVDDWVWVRVQVQQRGVGVHRARAHRRGTLGGEHQPLPRPHPRGAQALICLVSIRDRCVRIRRLR